MPRDLKPLLMFQRGDADDAFERLAEGGSVLMPLDNYGWSTRFGWVKDRFGFAWQLDVPAEAG